MQDIEQIQQLQKNKRFSTSEISFNCLKPFRVTVVWIIQLFLNGHLQLFISLLLTGIIYLGQVSRYYTSRISVCDLDPCDSEIIWPKQEFEHTCRMFQFCSAMKLLIVWVHQFPLVLPLDGTWKFNRTAWNKWLEAEKPGRETVFYSLLHNSLIENIDWKQFVKNYVYSKWQH